MKKFHDNIIALAFAVGVALQAWTLKEVVALKVTVAKVEARLDAGQFTASLRHASLPLLRTTDH